MNNSGYEIDFIPVDSGTKNGDAITMRVHENGITKIYVIDGGTKVTGQKVVDHIKEYYHTEHVDYLINTHPDLDHISGLTVVLEQLEVGEIWMHKPWEHAHKIIDDIIDNRVTVNSLTNRIQDSLKIAKEINDTAIKRNIKVFEPFQGKQIGHFKVLSPKMDWYVELIKGFNNMPPSETKTFATESSRQLSEAIDTIFENWNIETLSEDGQTSDKNESSVVLYGRIPNLQMLLTGDAGLQALTKAYDYSITQGINLKSCSFMQIPHHGGRRNISPSLLNKLIGPILLVNSPLTKVAYVNTSKDCPEHPKKSVSNAYQRRGVKVYATNGSIKCKYWGFEPRKGWTSATPIGFYNQVEK
ncbi:MAG: MBL fold metallo-hydrolase [Paludibacteraceae bacterium]|jgi:beta-lactamase superfamily II metal-dependent hydrolase|nr:MBL fold metallo-hydrolase [Paludibacteraceae bacterium]